MFYCTCNPGNYFSAGWEACFVLRFEISLLTCIVFRKLSNNFALLEKLHKRLGNDSEWEVLPSNKKYGYFSNRIILTIPLVSQTPERILRKMAMSNVCRTGGLLKAIFPVSARFTARTPGANGAPFTKNALIIRTSSGSVLQRIQKKQEEAIVGGGQKRIDTQHRKVSWPSSISVFFFQFSNRTVVRFKLQNWKIITS